jgi:hypothetical protein
MFTIILTYVITLVYTLTAGAARRVEIVTSLPRMQAHSTHHTYQPIQSIVSNGKRPAVYHSDANDSYALDVGNDSNTKATTTAATAANTDDIYEHDAHHDSSTQHKAYTGSCSSTSSSVVSSVARQSGATKCYTAASQPAYTGRSAPDTVSDIKSTSDTEAATTVAAAAARFVEANTSSSVNRDTTTRLAQDTESLPLPPLTVQQKFGTLTNSSDAIISDSVTPPQAMSNNDTTTTTRMRMSSDVAGNVDVQPSVTHSATSTPLRHTPTVAHTPTFADTDVDLHRTSLALPFSVPLAVIDTVPDIASTASSSSNRPAAVHSTDDMPVIAVHGDSLKCHTHATVATVDAPALQQQSTVLPASAVVSPGKSDDAWPDTPTNNNVQQQQQQQQQQRSTVQQMNSQRLSRAMALAAGVLRMAQNHYQHQHTAAATDGSTATTSVANRCK